MRAAEPLPPETWGVCLCVRARGRGSASRRASAGAAGGRWPPLPPAPPRPRLHRTRRPERAGQRLALTAARLPAVSAGRPAASSPTQPARAPLPAGALPPLLLLLSLLPSRAADRQPRRGECRYFAFRIICRTQASFRSALIFFGRCPLPTEKKIPLLKQTAPGAPYPSQSPTGCCACAVLSCSLFRACVE